jgi:hypothetical protein
MSHPDQRTRARGAKNMVEQDSFFVLVNAYPASVQAREVYSYKVEITANPDTSSTDSPQGHVQVRLPYDGFQHFSLEEAKRLKQQIVNRSDPTIQGRIGWLAVSPPLDWEHDWSRPTGAEVIPVQVPLRGEKFSETQWTSDQMCSVARHTYSPASLHFWPLNIEMQVFDDISVPEAETLRDYLSLLKSGNVQKGQLIIDLTITVLIPAVLARDDVHVWLEILELNWPVIAPERQLDVQQLRPPGHEDQTPVKVTWRYNPDRRVVQICKVQARRDEPDEGSPLVPFKCDMRFFLRVPGQIVNQDELKGSVRLRLDGILLSGREVGWLQVSGHRTTGQNQLIHQQTHLKAVFSAWLSDQFKYRRTTTYRRWCFSGVRLSADRLDDVAAALRDLGYQVKSPVLAEDGATGTLAASRPDVTPDGDPTLLQLEVLAERAPAAQTRRVREMEGVLITTEIETSDMVIHVRGQMRGPISMIALDLERLMTTLKGRFAAVADLR